MEDYFQNRLIGNIFLIFFLSLLSTKKYPESEQKVYCALTVHLQHNFFEASLYKQEESNFNCTHQVL